MKNVIKTEQTGRSMVEMLGVLAIIGVLSVGGISGYSKAMAKFKLTKVQDQLSMVIMNIRTAYATSPGYPGLDNSIVATNKLVSQEMVVGSTSSNVKLIHGLGGEVQISAVDSLDGIDDGAFGISLAGLGKDACVSLASSDWGTDGLLGITVASSGNATVTGANNLIEPSKLPISYSKALDYCKSNSKNVITWYYN